MNTTIRLALAGFFCCTLAACGGGGSSATLNSIAVTPADQTRPAGQTVQYTATGSFSDGSTSTTVPVIWNSSNPSTATINSAGLASTVAPGSTIIKATSSTNSSISGSTTLTVQ